MTWILVVASVLLSRGNCSFLQYKMKLQMMRTEKLCRAELPRSVLQPQSRCGGSCSCD